MKFFKLTTYALAFLLSAVFFAAHASAATQVYYSVGQSASDLKTGTPTVTISSGVATFSVGQYGNIGVGDRITYNNTEIAYISGRVSWTIWNVVTATGIMPVDIADATVNSITREYTSLAAAEAGATDANHLNTADLVTGNYQLNFPCYYDSGPDTTAVTVDGYTTGADNYIRIYAPNNMSAEANRWQRHGGAWDDLRYNLVITNNHGIKTQDGHIRLEGLQIRLTGVTGNRMGVFVTGSIGAGSDIRVFGNILRGDTSTGDWHMGIDVWQTSGSGVVNITNNVIYDFRRTTGSNAVGIGVEDGWITSRIYNNTIYNCGLGFYRWGGTAILKNNLIQATVAANYGGTIDASSTHNISQDATAPATGVYYRNKKVEFSDIANKNLHLSAADNVAKGVGADLSADANFAFNIDIDGNTRPSPPTGTWDIGADEGATAVYYSVGQNTTDHKTGSPTLTISGGIGTFSVAQTATNMGVGDKVTYNTTSVAYISQKISQTEWKLITATGGVPADVTTQTVNSIAHAFDSLNAATTGADGASYLGTANLLAGNFQVNFPCYYDSGPDTAAVSLNDWTTAQGNMLRIYTPTDIGTEVNRSQRHTGKWDDSKYRLVVSAAADYTKAIFFEKGYVWIDGLQIKVNNNDYNHAAGIELVYRTEYSISKVYISNNIITENHVTTNNDGFNAIQLLYSSGYVWNNIIYDTNIGGNSGNSAIMGYYNKHYVYNNIVYNSYGYGIRSNAGSVFAKNNVVQQASFSGGTFDAASSNNVSQNTTAPGANSKINTTVEFVDVANKDFHLKSTDTAARSAGTSLQADPYWAFERDIDGQARDGSWDIGADEVVPVQVETVFSGSSPDLANGLVGHWTFDGPAVNSDQALDMSASGNNGTIAGATVASGKLGQGMNFDGINDYVSVPDSDSLDLTTSFTLAAWIMPNVTGSDDGILIKSSDTNGSLGPYKFGIFAGNLYFGMNGGYSAVSTPFTAVNSWSHVVAKYDGSFAKLYINGTEVASSPYSTNPSPSIGELRIGDWSASDRIWSGKLDDVRIYNRALSAQEIGLLHKTGQTELQSAFGTNEGGLAAHWTFDAADISGASLTDKSGSGNHGTISGAIAGLGKLGQGLEFDGVDDYVSFADPITAFPKSVSYWVRPSTFSDGVHFGIYMPEGNWMAGGFYNGEYTTSITATGAPANAFSLNEWNHVTIIQPDAATILVYVNGAEVTGSVSDGFGTGSASTLGRRFGGPYSARFFAGRLDDFRIYDKVLSAEEITRLYKAGSAKIRK